MKPESAVTEEMLQAVGKPTQPEFPPETVTIWSIRRYVAATEDPNPLWTDDDYARRTRWSGVVAPPTFVEVYSPMNRIMREMGGELAGLVAPFPPPFQRQLLVSEDFEFYLPLRPGDSVSSRMVLGDVWEGGSQSGRMVFMREDKFYTNQKEETVAKVSWTRAFVENPAPVPLEPMISTTGIATRPTVIHPKQIHFDEVDVGMTIPEMEKRVTMTTIAKWGGATGDVGQPHFDAEYAQKEYGLPGIVAHGALSSAYLAQLLTNWMGGWGVLRKHSTRNRRIVRPGDLLTCKGRVVKKWVEGKENLVECETWTEDRNGMRRSLGQSVVSLPKGD